MNILDGNASPNDWIAILSDEKLQKQYIDSRKKGIRMNPTFESVVRRAIRYPKDDRQGDIQIQPQEEYIDTEKKRRISLQILNIIELSSCDFNELLLFITDTDLCEFYDYVNTNINSFDFSETKKMEIKLRYYISVLIVECNRLRSMRFSLQKKVRQGMSSVVNEACVSCKNFVDSWNEKGNDPRDRFYCYCCFILGCYSFFTFHWDHAVQYWQLSHYAYYHWHVRAISGILHAITSDVQLTPEEPLPTLNLNALVTLPSIAEDTWNHTCISSLESPPIYQHLFQNVKDHLQRWYSDSCYFSNMDVVKQDQKGQICLIMSFYLMQCTSEVVCLNQYLSFCNSSHVQQLLCEKDLSLDVIPFLHDISLLEFLIHFYSKKMSVLEKHRVIFDALMKQMQNPAINMFNDSQILTTEVNHLEQRLYRYLYLKHICN